MSAQPGWPATSRPTTDAEKPEGRPAVAQGWLRPLLVLFGAFTLLIGLGYPLLVTGLAQLCFPFEANGSLLREGGQVVGSELIGQPFSDRGHFWSRPSATVAQPYNGSASGADQLGPTNPALTAVIRQRAAVLRAADPTTGARVPVDLVTTSGSGLDPHISAAAAWYQVPRVAQARGWSEAEVHELIRQHLEHPGLGVVGEERVNVLRLNRALDRGAGSRITPGPPEPAP